MARLLDPKKNGRWPFEYTPSAETDLRYLRSKFKRIQRQQKANATERAAKVAPLKRRNTS